MVTQAQFDAAAEEIKKVKAVRERAIEREGEMGNLSWNDEGAATRRTTRGRRARRLTSVVIPRD